MRAVVVVEFDLPDDLPNAIPEAVAALGAPEHAVARYAAIKGDADRVLAVFTDGQK